MATGLDDQYSKYIKNVAKSVKGIAGSVNLLLLFHFAFLVWSIYISCLIIGFYKARRLDNASLIYYPGLAIRVFAVLKTLLTVKPILVIIAVDTEAINNSIIAYSTILAPFLLFKDKKSLSFLFIISVHRIIKN